MATRFVPWIRTSALERYSLVAGFRTRPAMLPAWCGGGVGPSAARIWGAGAMARASQKLARAGKLVRLMAWEWLMTETIERCEWVASKGSPVGVSCDAMGQVRRVGRHARKFGAN